MGSIKEEAKAYEPKQMQNIADLDKVSTDMALLSEEFPNEAGGIDIVKYLEIDGIRYRVPVSVLKNLKAILEENPNLKTFKVKKQGEGMKTSYTVIPLA